MSTLANTATGIHAGSLTRTLATNLTTRYLLAKNGTTPGTVEPCGAADTPVGLLTDTGLAGDPVTIQLLGQTGTTLLMVAATAITAGTDLYTAAGGKVAPQPNDTATVFHLGRALTSTTAANQLIEVEAIHPRKTIILGVLPTDPTETTLILNAAFLQKPDRLIALPLT